MRKPSNLNEIEQKVDLYFDKALSQDDEQELIKSIEKSNSAKKVFNNAKTYRTFIKDNVHRPLVSPDFIKTIKDKIRVV